MDLVPSESLGKTDNAHFQVITREYRNVCKKNDLATGSLRPTKDAKNLILARASQQKLEYNNPPVLGGSQQHLSRNSDLQALILVSCFNNDN